jgi:hypothetical protein
MVESRASPFLASFVSGDGKDSDPSILPPSAHRADRVAAILTIYPQPHDIPMDKIVTERPEVEASTANARHRGGW